MGDFLDFLRSVDWSSLREVALFIVIFGGLALAVVVVFVRSFSRNVVLHRRHPLTALVVAGLAVWLWPVTLWYWLFGPTPERRARERRR